ncbi:Crp/Fnr family transcriptional regulator [Thioalkalivibrio sulfidiphilus]|uniref:Crp/Fnr family transcriptional regulator n=1 Tax=Thioalkalivibrio sulfidiphilus TaxID=1033854 RepID=UPI0003A4B6DF|nr:Crp/Fnr family transcriptional regulator [Thioalkalivibrio sulfidiphilus]
MTAAQKPHWTRHFPTLDQVDDPTGLGVLADAREIQAPEGAVVFRPGSVCEQYLLVTEGSVRVQQTSSSGREIVLYRVQTGESCVLTTSCLLGGNRYGAEGICETQVNGIAIPAPRFMEGIESSPGFRRFVFQGYGQRIAELMTLIDEVAFGRLNVRLAQRLLELAHGQDALHCTHQDLAVELGSAREVVSRALKDFERQGWVHLSRGQIDLLDRPALERLAKG